MSNLKKMPGMVRSETGWDCEVAAYWFVMIVLRVLWSGGRGSFLFWELGEEEEGGGGGEGERV